MAQKIGFREVLQQTGLYPQEQVATVLKSNKSLFIGLPKEISSQENRIALTPDSVALIVRNGHEVLLEAGAGLNANFTDSDYSEAGAQIVYSAKELYQADLIVKIEPLQEAEFELVKEGSTVISALHLPSRSEQYFRKLNELKITGIGFELIQDKDGGLPVTRAMSEIAGSTVMLIAAEYLSSVNNGKGIILGGITGVPPTKVVILGAGTVAEYSARAAMGLGAEIKIFDREVYRLQRIKYAIGPNIYTSIIDSDTLSDAIRRADVVIGALRGHDGRSPCVVTEEMISSMQENSVVIDVCIDQGGCFETSRMTNHKDPVYKYQGVIHYCVPNIASRVSATASVALSNIFTPFLLKSGTLGGIEEMIFVDKDFMKGVYSYKGSLTNLTIAQNFGMRYKDLSLLMAARF
ncbi:MAG: alanine dehydrogenase [Bacteroidota bacterium]